MTPNRYPGRDRLRTYRDAEDFLQSLVRTPPRTRDERERLGLSPIESLLDRIGNPHRGLAAIHITGSKGKGSTALYTEALLAAAGLRTGAFTSPHLEHWNERIRVAGAPIARSEFVAALERVRPAVAALHRADPDAAPAFFDALVAAAFSVFAEAPVDVAVIEAGIGARLDPTRTCRAVATCVTGVELEHTEQLGPTVADIAREKAAIVRPGIPLVTGSMPESARAVLEDAAARAGAPLRRLGRDVTIRLDVSSRVDLHTRAEFASGGSPPSPPGSSRPRPVRSATTSGDLGRGPHASPVRGVASPDGDLSSTGPASGLPPGHGTRARAGGPAGSLRETGPVEIVLSGRTVPVALRQPGRHMAENAALALALVDEIGALRRLDDAAAADALAAAVLPGRVEVLRESPLVVADGAHTRASIEALVEVLDPRDTARFVAVVSVTRGKDAAHMLRPLVRRADVVIATAAEPSRSLCAEALARVLRISSPQVPIETIPAPGDAIRAAVRLAGDDGTVCVTGSMYLAGAARRNVQSG